jgi:hypothetical protein
MIPDQQEREHCLDWMAYKVQHPAAKINHGILHGGRQGSGKDTLWVPFLYAVGGKGWQNVKTVTTEEIQSNFHYHLLSEVCVLNELREPALADRRALENKLKPLLAAPPEVFSINEKGRHPYPALNRLSVLGFSNERVSLSLSADDRRWMVLWSEAGILPQDEAKRLWAWYESGGLDHVAYWLRQRDVSAFAPGERPLMTDAKAVMLEGGLSLARRCWRRPCVTASGRSGLGPSWARGNRWSTRCKSSSSSTKSRSSRSTSRRSTLDGSTWARSARRPSTR